jgi:hypothetical protein
VLKGLSWEPTTPFSRGEALDVMQRLVFDFDRDIEPEAVKLRNGEVAVVWWRPDGNNSAVTAIRTASGVNANSVTVRGNLVDIRQAFEVADTGTFVIDLNCDFVLDGQGQPVSSCSTSLIATHLPRPGGILRTWLLVRG